MFSDSETSRMNENTPIMGRKDTLADISDTSVRHGFIRKVYSILFCQLAFTTLIGGLIMKFCDSWRYTNQGLIIGLTIGCSVIVIATLCFFQCYPHLMTKTPENYCILFIFTAAEGVMIGFICINYTKESVLIIFGVTAFIVFGLTIIAFQTTFSLLEGCFPFIACAMLAMSGISLAFLIGWLCGLANTPAFHIMYMVFCALACFICSIAIVMDTQMIVGGKNGPEFGIDDYIPAVILLYTDIINLFIYLLMLFGERK